MSIAVPSQKLDLEHVFFHWVILPQFYLRLLFRANRNQSTDLHYLILQNNWLASTWMKHSTWLKLSGLNIDLPQVQNWHFQEPIFSRAHILDLGYQFHYQFITILIEFIFMPSFLHLCTFQCSETQWVFCSTCFFAFYLFHKVTFNFQYFHIFFMSSVNSFRCTISF